MNLVFVKHKACFFCSRPNKYHITQNNRMEFKIKSTYHRSHQNNVKIVTVCRFTIPAAVALQALPKRLIWTFPRLWNGVTEVLHDQCHHSRTVLPRVPAECLKGRNFSSPRAVMRLFDWQSACYSTSPIVPVMSGTQVNKPADDPSAAVCKQANYWISIQHC